ncbi:unnamed protein product [Allacma fusca]|uniref:Uncharacterized protein n=1 Tax=Allacma fusca TaxID=39272 RepID=A0A8J2NPC5_9HEXA|nr:unnamed protein product [Allacma fusca]
MIIGLGIQPLVPSLSHVSWVKEGNQDESTEAVQNGLLSLVMRKILLLLQKPRKGQRRVFNDLKAEDEDTGRGKDGRKNFRGLFKGQVPTWFEKALTTDLIMSFRDPQSNRYYGSVPESSQVKRVLLQRKTKERNEKDNEDSPQAPDSTTEPPKPAHDFQEGDDVFFQNEEGQNILGTIGQVTPLRCQILFGDGTQQWAPFKRIKKLSCSFNEPSVGFPDSRESEAKKKVKTELVCIICEGIKKISSKKAESYSADTPFTCARCTAAKVVPTPAKVVANLNEAYQRVWFVSPF